ncbi:alpha/beta fold hydrolase [Terriglobus sp. TAA 43]|uniref:alpha/beta fold hydrolase n=1 Tax=Terriglobus sp. TAA 43 TaxID=278961 RepID=UPI0006463FB1|nr:alpha/beta fold hydrolase [Terriglobus sp. TAA 43]
MGYEYPIDAKAMFEDRFGEFVGLGVPKAEVAEMQTAITDMWSNAPGGWVYEWSRLAQRHADANEMFLASLAYGCAKFPCLANDARRTALPKQVETYLAAAPGFPVKFERRLIDLPYKGSTTTVPAHFYSATGQYGHQPILLFNGGVDTWKMDSHGIFIALAQHLPVTVMAFDQPGTGETDVPLSAAADEVVLGLVAEARRIGNGKLAHFGMSFGANYSAMTGLLKVVDASIILGGPVDHAFAPEALQKLPYGMQDIIANDMGFDRQPSEAEFMAAADKLARRDLLARPDNAPLLVINGADDYFVPQADTLLFENRKDCEVHLIPGTGHCAFSKLPEVMSLIAHWLPTQLGLTRPQ